MLCRRQVQVTQTTILFLGHHFTLLRRNSQTSSKPYTLAHPLVQAPEALTIFLCPILLAFLTWTDPTHRY